MSNAVTTPVKGQEQDKNNKESERRGAQMRYPEGGCRIDGHQGYGCTCNPIPARP